MSLKVIFVLFINNVTKFYLTALKDFLKDSDDGKKWLQLTKKDKERGEIQLEITTE